MEEGTGVEFSKECAIPERQVATAALRRHHRVIGYTSALLGAIAATPDPLLIRLATREGGTFWWIITTKSFFTCGFVLITAGVRHGWRALPAGFCAGPAHIGLVSALQSLVIIGFPGAFQLTTAAKALLLISLNPLWAGLLGWRLLGDVLHRRTAIALIAAGASVGFIIVPPAVIAANAMPTANMTSSGDVSATDVGGQHQWRGDVVAVGTGLALAALIAASRYGAQKRPKALMGLAPAIGGFLAGIVTLPVAYAVSPTGSAQLTPLFWPIMLADAACIALTTVLALSVAPRYISTAEVALVLLVENVLGPLWVFLGGYEAPTMWTLIGGVLLILSLATHEVAALAASRREKRSEAALRLQVQVHGGEHKQEASTTTANAL
jgi:drug/metabolite transporter (DMT)-like permease